MESNLKPSLFYHASKPPVKKGDQMPEKTIICRHYEQITKSIGTCIYCGQVRDYTGKRPRILKRGRIDGVLTEINPPDERSAKPHKGPWPLQPVTDRLGTRGVKRF